MEDSAKVSQARAGRDEKASADSTSEGPWCDEYPGLDFMRTLSHLWAVAHHWGYSLKGFLEKHIFQYFFLGKDINIFVSGHRAITCFFVLSGFLHIINLFDKFEQNKVEEEKLPKEKRKGTFASFKEIYLQFIFRRILKLWPMLLLTVIAHIALPIGLPFDSLMGRRDWVDYASILLIWPTLPFFLYEWFPKWMNMVSVEEQYIIDGKLPREHHHFSMLYLWSIATEMHFYLIAPVIAFLLFQCHRYMRLVASVMMGCLGLYVSYSYYEYLGFFDPKNFYECFYEMSLVDCDLYRKSYYYTYSSLCGRAGEISLGIILAVMFRYHRNVLQFLMHFTLIPVSILVVCAKYINQDFWHSGTDSLVKGEYIQFSPGTRESYVSYYVISRTKYALVPFTTMAVLLSMSLAKPNSSVNRALFRVFNNRFWTSISNLTYTNYLVHCFVFVFAMDYFPQFTFEGELNYSGFCIQFLACLCLSLFISTVIQRVYERPVQKYILSSLLDTVFHSLCPKSQSRCKVKTK
eukprot:Nk52_evm10s2506 gene=Nk52_evmTU10s2506